MARKPTRGSPVLIETTIKGRRITGYYQVETTGRYPLIYVTAHGGKTKSTQLGDSDPEILASIMLLEVAPKEGD